VTAALGQGSTGPYQLQAATAAVHDETETMDDTDWPQILGLWLPGKHREPPAGRHAAAR
jgi:predicted RNA polymerase sigma factor